MIGRAKDVRRWALRWNVVAERIHAEPAPSAETSLQSALSLVDHLESIHGWPLPLDPIRERETAEARTRWKLLLDRWPG